MLLNGTPVVAVMADVEHGVGRFTGQDDSHQDREAAQPPVGARAAGSDHGLSLGALSSLLSSSRWCTSVSVRCTTAWSFQRASCIRQSRRDCWCSQRLRLDRLIFIGNGLWNYFLTQRHGSTADTTEVFGIFTRFSACRWTSDPV